jgi:hypothetical protein
MSVGGPLIAVDANIVLGRCFPPGIDQYADVAREVFSIIGRNSRRAAVLDTVSDEIDSTLRTRLGRIAEVCREIVKEAELMPSGATDDPRIALESMVTSIRSRSLSLYAPLMIPSIPVDRRM